MKTSLENKKRYKALDDSTHTSCCYLWALSDRFVFVARNRHSLSSFVCLNFLRSEFGLWMERSKLNVFEFSLPQLYSGTSVWCQRNFLWFCSTKNVLSGSFCWVLGKELGTVNLDRISQIDWHDSTEHWKTLQSSSGLVLCISTFKMLNGNIHRVQWEVIENQSTIILHRIIISNRQIH